MNQRLTVAWHPSQAPVRRYGGLKVIVASVWSENPSEPGLEFCLNGSRVEYRLFILVCTSDPSVIPILSIPVIA